jgi:hypothetical protein
MLKRTRGTEEFEFEQYEDKGHVRVIIMVSGWMTHEEDYKRSFGVIPAQLSLSVGSRRKATTSCFCVLFCCGNTGASVWHWINDVLE